MRFFAKQKNKKKKRDFFYQKFSFALTLSIVLKNKFDSALVRALVCLNTLNGNNALAGA